MQDRAQVGDPGRVHLNRTNALTRRSQFLLALRRDVDGQITGHLRWQFAAAHPEDVIDNRRDLSHRVIAHPLQGSEVKTLQSARSAENRRGITPSQQVINEPPDQPPGLQVVMNHRR
jgi:hypothetical protein